MKDWQSKLIHQLNLDQPDWYMVWADQRDLLDLSAGRINAATLRNRVAQRILHRVLNSAITAGIVQETTP